MLFVFRGKSKFLFQRENLLKNKKFFLFSLSAHKLCRPVTFLFTSIVAHQTHKFTFEEGCSKCLESLVWGSTADPLITKSQNQTEKGPVWAFELWWNYCVCGRAGRCLSLIDCGTTYTSVQKFTSLFLVSFTSIIHYRVGARVSIYQYLCRNGFRVTHTR